MKRRFLKTADGSITIQIEDWDEQYHSKHGALAEARHVFIAAGLDHFNRSDPSVNPVSILEIGFGTGLNALLSLQYATSLGIELQYQGVEGYPVAAREWEQLNYGELLNMQAAFVELHQSPWDEWVSVSTAFQLKKREQLFDQIDDQASFDLIYFDAFGARVQPELWTEDMFRKMFAATKPGGVLVTYAAKGSVRRAMQTAGFEVERLPGPPGKREMLRASKKR